MADIELVIKMPEEAYNLLKTSGVDWLGAEHILNAVANGTPLDTHDEEIIATTVESIWGKPPYTEVLDKIRAEIEEQVLERLLDNGDDWFTADKVDECLEIIDKYKTEKEVTE